MSSVIVRRTSDSAGLARKMKVVEGDEVVAELKPGEEVRLDLRSGIYEFRGQMDWCSSPALSLTLEPDEVAIIELEFPFSSIFAVYFRPRSALRVRQI